MKVLLAGIYTLYNNDSSGLKSSLTNGLHLNEPPQGQSRPYATMFLLPTSQDNTFGEFVEAVPIQFNIFSENSSASDIDAIFQDLIALYDYASPTISGYTSVAMVRDWYNLDKLDEVWQYSVQYTCTMQRN